MRSVRKLALALVATLALAAPLGAANLSLFTGPSGTNPIADTALGAINQLVQTINSGVGGLLNDQTGSVGTTAVTTEETLLSYTMPANTLAAAGQSIRVTCFFTTGATANNKTVKLYFGASVISTPTYAGNAQVGRLSFIVTRTAAATQKFFGSGMAGTGSLTPVAEVYTAGTDSLTAGVLIKCTGTNGTAAANDIVANGLLTELIK